MGQPIFAASRAGIGEAAAAAVAEVGAEAGANGGEAGGSAMIEDEPEQVGGCAMVANSCMCSNYVPVNRLRRSLSRHVSPPS